MIHPVTISITSEHIKDGKYVGPYDLRNIEGHLEFAADLGLVVVDGDIAASKSIYAKEGTGIKAGLTIKSRWISASSRIFAGLVSWRLPAPDEEEIHAEIRRGTVACGRVIAPSDASSL